MAKIWKVIGIVMSVLVIGALGFCGIWTVRNWNTVYSSFDGTSFYTYEDMQKLKQDTIEECAKNEVAYKDVINNLRENVINLEEKNKTLEEENSNLLKENETCKEFINNYESEIISVVSFIADDFLIDVFSVNNGALLSGIVSGVERPSKEDYEFLGWSTDGVNVIQDLDSIIIDNNIAFYAVFSKIHTVTFIVDDKVVATQKVSNGRYASNNVTFEEENFTFKYWTVNGQKISLWNYQIFSDTEIIAEIAYDSWVYLNTQTLNFITSGNYNEPVYFGTYVWTDGENAYYSYNDTQYVFNSSNNVWELMTWNGLTNFCGNDIWTDGVNVYYSKGDQYILDKVNKSWNKISWNGKTNFYANYIWTDGTNIYYSVPGTNYQIDTTNRKTIEITWNGLTSFYGSYVWFDGNNAYYSNGSEQYILNKTTKTWSQIVWKDSYSDDLELNGEDIWTDGVNVYFMDSYSEYILDRENQCWVIDYDSFTGLPYGYYLASSFWTDGTNYYCSCVDLYNHETKHYIRFNK